MIGTNMSLFGCLKSQGFPFLLLGHKHELRLRLATHTLSCQRLVETQMHFPATWVSSKEERLSTFST